MSRLKGLKIALENEELLPVPAEEIEPIPADVEAESGVMAEKGAEVEDICCAIEEAGEDMDQLEKIEDVVSDSVESGEGMDPVAAEMTDIAVEAIRERLGLPGRRLAPSLEGFNDRATRLTHSRVALESIGETIKKGFETIKKAIAALFERIVGFFQKHLGANASLLKAIDKVKEASKNIPGGQPEASELKDERNLAIDLGNVPPELIKKHTEVTTRLIALNGTVSAIADDLVECVEKKGGDGNAALHDEMVTAFDSIVHKDMSCKQAQAPKVTKCFNLGGMYQGQSIFAVVEGKEGTEEFKIRVFKDQLHPESAVTKVLQVLSPTDQITFLENLAKLVEVNEKLMKEKAPLEKCRSTVEKALNKAMTEYGEEAKSDIADLRFALGYFMSMMSHLNLSIPVMNVALVKSGLRYIVACQKQYKK
jgi:hypothetical protein